MKNQNYCVFIDVLGYGELVKDPTKSQDQKINILRSIYENLASTISTHINEVNERLTSKIFIKSFSDCIYLESSDLLSLLYSCRQIFMDTFNLYTNLPPENEYTPFIRGGLVKDWTIRFKDLSSFVDNQQSTNPVGLGVARAYQVSEKSKLSGMRLIISDEIIKDLLIKKESKNDFDYYVQEVPINGVPDRLYFDKITKNEDNCDVNLYEMIWTAPLMSDCTKDNIKHLNNLRVNFDSNSMRHFRKTAEMLFKGLLVSNCNRNGTNVFEIAKREIQDLMK
jgi:hypothetical protein